MEEIQEFNAIEQTANAALELALAIEVTDQVSAEESKNKAVELKNILKRVEEIRKEKVKPLNDEVSEINAKAKAITGPLDKAKDNLAGKLMKWQNEERMKAEAEAEEKRKAAQAEMDAALRNDDASFDDVQKADLKVEIASRPVEISKAFKPLQTRENWTYRVVDLSQVPADLIVLNTAEVNRRVKSGVRQIPGLEIYSEEVAVVR
jgi:hypothetical protein